MNTLVILMAIGIFCTCIPSETYAQSPDTTVYLNTFNGTTGQTWADALADGWTGFQVDQVYDPDPTFYPGDHFLGLKWYYVNKLGAWMRSPAIDFGALQTFVIDFWADGHGWLNIYIEDSLNIYHLKYEKLPDALGTLELLHFYIRVEDAFMFSPKYNPAIVGETRLYIEYINPNKNRIGRILDFDLYGEEGTVWLGNQTNLWFENDDWTNGHPTRRKVGLIPNGRPRYPFIYGDAESNILKVEDNAYFVVTPQSTLTSYDTLFMDGQFNMIIYSDSSSTGSYIDKAGISGNGTAYIEQWVSEEKWHYTSSPVVEGLSKTYLSLYLIPFLEAQNGWGDFIVPLDVPLGVMQGYGVWSSATNPPMGDTTVWFDGRPNTGIKSIQITNSSFAGDPQKDGWNLVGNPYPSALHWDSAGWNKSATTGAMYLWDPISGINSVYLGNGVGIPQGTTGEIPPGQGFFVKAVENGTFSVSNQARIHSDTKWFKNGSTANPPNLLHLTVSGNNRQDQTAIRFQGSASTLYENNSDAFKLMSSQPEVPQIFSYSVDVPPLMLSINTQPDLDDSVSIPLGFYAGQGGNFTLGPNQLQSFHTNCMFILEDLLLDSLIDFRQVSDYAFYGDTSHLMQRFMLHIYPTSLEALLAYDGDSARPISGVGVSMAQGNANPNAAFNRISGANGLFRIGNLPDGLYQAQFNFQGLPWIGSNATDALLAARSFVGLENLNQVRQMAADVDGSGYVNTADALAIQKRFVGLTTSFQGDDWVSAVDSFAVNGNQAWKWMVPALCRGDVNGSGSNVKMQGRIEILHRETLKTDQSQVRDITLSAGQDASLGAISLVLRLPEKMKVEHLQIIGSKDKAVFHQEDNLLRVSWFSLEGLKVKEGDPLLLLSANIPQGTKGTISVESVAEAANPDGLIIPDFRLLAPQFGQVEGTSSLSLFPNPASTQTLLTANFSNEQKIQVQISDMKGSVVRSWNLEAPEGKLAQILRLQGLKSGRYILSLIPEKENEPSHYVDLIILE